MWRLATNKAQTRFLVGLALGTALLASGPVFAEETAGERYAKLLAEVDSMARYNEQMSKQLESQQQQVALIEQQITDIDATGAAIGPLVQKMFESLEKFVASDLPFTDPTQAGPDSRSDRINKIREMMTNEGVSNAERYRRLLEAYQIELDYGRNMVAYKGKLGDGRDAEFLRVGRVSLMYRTIDGKETGYWDAQQKKMIADDNYNKQVERALLIAKKEVAPDLVVLPVPAPQEVRL